ncbi:major facilitator superfamily transporter [Diplodia corticola]|uniref:Major facilitator superfamily transporter n=1 Tax=Diplodia corticola TaxID=236234 RepID=A0A1J9RAY8_9PEZI|nr:major facilitator superfamily transporter [Diplodia corticola]OJD37720.1 major facilitator superfamily transporter [Diplodia corticola]
MALHHDEDNKPTADFVEYPDPDKDHGVLPAPQKGVDAEQAALYREFEAKDDEWHHYMKKKLMRKVDWHLLPLLILMYLLNFLDRSNLAQARLGTLEEDLNMVGTDYNLATSILFVGYLLMQIPSNLLLTRIRPSMYLGVCMAIWGAISAAQAATQSFGGLVAARFFLGFAEAPFFAGAIFLMSSWYTRAELAHRISRFYAGSALANAFGGLLGAGCLGNLHMAHGISGWRWLFIIEGVITVGVALVAAVVLPDYPANTRWLTPQERSYAQWRLVDDTGEADEATASTVLDGVKLAMRDPKLYIFTLLQHASLLSQTFQYFFPTVVETLGYGKIETLLITAPVWIATFLVGLFVTWTSGRSGDRSIHIVCLSMISCVGNIICIATLNINARFFAIFLMPMGAVAGYQIVITWVANTFPRPLVKRSACISFANMVGNSANIYGPYMYPSSSGPRYVPGGAATATAALLVALLALAIRFVLAARNRDLERGEVEDAEGVAAAAAAGARRDGLGLGEEARPVGFRYIL